MVQSEITDGSKTDAEQIDGLSKIASERDDGFGNLMQIETTDSMTSVHIEMTGKGHKMTSTLGVPQGPQ